ncbi:hypothetical protein XH91_27415 [Bradyrhizobium guangzhouense]|uniref:Uncharacterized protein n=1 Tax=Bradyrhizobium guangzhouense TaxID=1325095 RepID=A0AAE6CAH9_9BRAD|nr:hypothetical protein XH91_27415 [Bradyrhizobium guangzhouense]
MQGGRVAKVVVLETPGVVWTVGAFMKVAASTLALISDREATKSGTAIVRYDMASFSTMDDASWCRPRAAAFDRGCEPAHSESAIHACDPPLCLCGAFRSARKHLKMLY